MTVGHVETTAQHLRFRRRKKINVFKLLRLWLRSALSDRDRERQIASLSLTLYILTEQNLCQKSSVIPPAVDTLLDQNRHRSQCLANCLSRGQQTTFRISPF
jgi:hypothetical protein